VLADCTLSETGEKQALLQQALIAQLAHSEKLDGMTLPEPDAPPARHALDARRRIVLNDGVVSYNDRPIINHLSWTVNPANTGRSSAPTAPVNPRC
jgi:molybdate transport system ATP-binding protein